MDKNTNAPRYYRRADDDATRVAAPSAEAFVDAAGGYILPPNALPPYAAQAFALGDAQQRTTIEAGVRS